MKILFLSRLFYPHIGGVEKHVLEISKRLTEKGHSITVITEFCPNDLNYRSGEEIVNGVKIVRIKAGKDDWFRKFRIWQELWRNRNLIKKADIIHCHDVFYWYLPFKLFCPQKKVFTTFHGYEFYPVSKKAIIIRKISEILSTGNICIGEFIRKWYHTKPDYVSYGAAERVKPVTKTIRDDSAVFIGRLDEQTGIMTYLKAIDILRKKYKDFVFTIVGDGYLRDQIGKKNKQLGFKKDAANYFYQHNFAFVSGFA